MKRFILVALCMFALPASAETLYGVQLLKVYAQGHTESTAHFIQVNQTLPAACHMNRLYIDLADKELFAAALASFHAGKTVDIIWVPNAPVKAAAGHAATPCKVLSIF